ncbi:MAG: hypothetical protein A2600_10570 [Candidatus Lambdaproteobacteria bacterium RIFOXYD1_FULL_56_27]|uniref:Ribosomal protein L11 methyltransferase n=1 Tax=Candidatus Lambdaproteobacteria bacterium RIFOXYD2_FULL_56_26 TaxID=1817773 RepID=A0A1F6GZ56_9PROT|nr:MAG: hypothetical protein A2426_01015 [Candidatus Lambdaproteobacteria bacterium RIFOXYC1_FULL_56_13]OGH03435.1 MAG: hypothetical protein A2557_01630 [Candidatus Lambdaproteobacteria bacterium RIFOXYD2_FULL_56_26]OGH08220.1 MAG: hypothetical protein A2600_10570 [Candidatus Lambdaproteobacteria bacterium RIFOXYD1_FULL_56_27]
MLDSYREVRVLVSKSEAEMAGWLFGEEGALGLEEVGEVGDRLELKIYFPDQEDLVVRALERAQRSLGDRLTVGEQAHRPAENWQAYWKVHFKPLPIGKRFLVRPPWETNPEPGRLEIVINPAQGFGTGYHETTRLTLLGLESIAEQVNQPFIDVGTGSGILAIGALKLGAPHGVGLDIEAEAIAELPMNLELSGLDPRRLVGVLARPDQWDHPAPLVLANITGDVILHFAADLKRLCTGHLILSGIMVPYLDPLKRAFCDWDLTFEAQEGEWYGLVYRRPL